MYSSEFVFFHFSAELLIFIYLSYLCGEGIFKTVFLTAPVTLEFTLQSRLALKYRKCVHFSTDLNLTC